MKWIDQYQLFLFDLDGLLVNTEILHFQAYVNMCAKRGYPLDWDFNTYCAIAHLDADALRTAIYARFPLLKEQEPNWSVLYQEKKLAYLELLHAGPAPLMPDVEDILGVLDKKKKKRCVVTHSMKELVDLLREQNPILNTIPVWFTREDYSDPKPHPAGYLKAIQLLADPLDAVIGFEDSIRGIKSLMGTKARPIMINNIDSAACMKMQKSGIATFRTFGDLLKMQDLPLTFTVNNSPYAKEQR